MNTILSGTFNQPEPLRSKTDEHGPSDCLGLVRSWLLLLSLLRSVLPRGD
jgi:hypothetical protein